MLLCFVTKIKTLGNHEAICCFPFIKIASLDALVRGLPTLPEISNHVQFVQDILNYISSIDTKIQGRWAGLQKSLRRYGLNSLKP